ncbi:RecX family transcriptional regulator [Candidatus Parcubacteria bacterium]|nr:RecX family transcriptional regulator [Candidatus Parcubacteria bacterium]
MPKVTAIKPQKRAGRFNIYLDDKFAFGLDAEALVKSGLASGQEMSPPEVERLKEENAYGNLLNKALKFLSFRPRSEFEVRTNLKKGVLATPKIIDRVVAKLGDLDLVGDLDFANWWVEQRTAHRPRGRRLLWQELRAKGVSQEIVEQVLEEKADQLDEVSFALKAAQKKFRTYFSELNTPPVGAGDEVLPTKSDSLQARRKRGCHARKGVVTHSKLEPREFEKKLSQYLARRGFGWEVIREVVKKSNFK